MLDYVTYTKTPRSVSGVLEFGSVATLNSSICIYTYIYIYIERERERERERLCFVREKDRHSDEYKYSL